MALKVGNTAQLVPKVGANGASEPASPASPETGKSGREDDAIADLQPVAAEDCSHQSHVQHPSVAQFRQETAKEKAARLAKA